MHSTPCGVRRLGVSSILGLLMAGGLAGTIACHRATPTSLSNDAPRIDATASQTVIAPGQTAGMALRLVNAGPDTVTDNFGSSGGVPAGSSCVPAGTCSSYAVVG